MENEENKKDEKIEKTAEQAENKDVNNKKDIDKKEEEKKIEKSKNKEEKDKNKAEKKKEKAEKKRLKKEEKEKKPKKKRKIFRIILLTLIAILIFIIAFLFWYVHDKLNKVQHVDLSGTDLGIAQQTEEQLDEYRNIALFGIDSRQDEYSMGNRSDCIIILSINDKTKDAKVFSVYRDTFVNIDGHGLDKITHAYSYGEAPLAIKTLNKNLDLNIKEFATVNFSSLVKTIDKIGGVPIEITEVERNYINAGAPGLAKLLGKTTPSLEGTGVQRLNGVQAVTFARNRSTEGGDYKRAERMRTVFVAVIDELKKKNIFELNDIADEILPLIYTNIPSSEIFDMIPKAATYNISESRGWPYDTKGITLDRWYGVPVTLESNVEKLHKEFFGQTEYVVPDSIKEISNSIIQKTGLSQ